MAFRRIEHFFSKNNGEKFMTANPQEDLMNLLIDKTISAGHILSFKEASEDPEMVKPNDYAAYFGSFDRAAQLAWNKVSPPITSSDGLTDYGRELARKLKNAPNREKIITYERKVRTSKRKAHFHERERGNQMSKNRHKDRKPKYTAEQIKEQLIEFYKKTNRLPTQDDAKACNNNLPSWGTLIKYLGPKDVWMDIVHDGAVSLSTPEGPIAEKNVVVGPVNNEYPQEAANEEIAIEQDIARQDASIDNDGTPNSTTDNGISSQNDEPSFNNDESSLQDDEPKIETTHQEQNDLVTVEMKITLPNREKPVFITLTV